MPCPSRCLPGALDSDDESRSVAKRTAGNVRRKEREIKGHHFAPVGVAPLLPVRFPLPNTAIQDFIAGRKDQRCIFHKEGLIAGSQQRFVTRDVPCLERFGDTLSHIDSQTVQRQVCKHSPAAEISQRPDWTRKSRRSIRSHGQPVRASLAEDWSTIKMAGWNI